MKEFTYTIQDPLGFHVRPASVLIKNLAKTKPNIKLRHKDQEVNAKSMLSVLKLGIKQGEEVTFIVDGEDEEQVCNELAEFMKANF